MEGRGQGLWWCGAGEVDCGSMRREEEGVHGRRWGRGRAGTCVAQQRRATGGNHRMFLHKGVSACKEGRVVVQNALGGGGGGGL